MALTFLELTPYAMVVMDGQRCVAKARRMGSGTGGRWILRVYDASWVDTPTNERQRANFKRLGLRWDVSPWLKSVDTRAQARKELQTLAGLRRGK